MTLAASPARRVVLAGASGTIGKAVAAALAAAGHETHALARADFSSPALLAQRVAAARAEVVISCIASRSGAPSDAWAVDHDSNRALLAAAEAAGARQFILLSAICVQKPRLAFQHAKLAFEAALVQSPITHTIIRPTAFFKSLSGQVARVRAGKPFLLFGDGELTSCKPISDADLARFILAAIDNPEAAGRILPVGGPGPAITPREQGELLFAAARRPARFRSVSPGLFAAAARVLGLGAGLSPWCAAKAEYARIAHYYATESMLVWDPASGRYRADLTPEFGSETLSDHYRRLMAKG
ncbi:NAD(P)H-binding protein [Erythrobacter cryptus]|uniref:NAD(P)H-binding protein n=1 Tax=Erythrobacter cryptus TaxID=196588 RepID=UPI00040AD544|nr:NAD(P)H-binding protein [Erythrobacter cryptus]GIX19846.1 MAG: epimerase [Erythrobacter sp.]